MSLARDITTVGSGTLASRLLAYARDAWIAALLGAGPYSETLFAVLQVVNFFRRLLSEGALNSAFVPIWMKQHGWRNQCQPFHVARPAHDILRGGQHCPARRVFRTLCHRRHRTGLR